MGLYYTLSNGEDIEIRIQESEEYEQEVTILLFNGGTSLTYPLTKPLILNDIITDIEQRYEDLKNADMLFFYKCNGFYD